MQQGNAGAKEWLVKTAVEVCGPYTFEELEEAIRSKEFILVDEVSKSFGRWKHIREEPAFEKVILEIQNKAELSQEKTFTQTETDVLTEEISNQVVNFSHAEKLLASVKAHEEKISESPKQQIKETPKKVYGVADTNKKSLVSLQRIFRWCATAALVVGFSFFFFYKGKQQELSFDQYKQSAIGNINAGDFEKARIDILNALSIKEDNELLFLIASLDLNTGDSANAFKNFELLKHRTNNSQALSQIYNYLGVISLKNYNLSRARLEFETALEQNPRFVQALYNRGVVDYLENKFEPAFQNFVQATVHGGLDGTILLSIADVLPKRNANLSNDEKQSSVRTYLGFIQKHIQSFHVFRQELFIAAAYLNSILNNQIEVERNIKLALDTAPDLTSQHVMDQALYRGLISWDLISEWADVLQKQYPMSESVKTLLGYSYFRGTEKIKGKEFIEALLKPDFSNVLNQNVHGYILYSLGQNREALTALEHTKDRVDYSLSNLLIAKICLEDKDYDCAQRSFEKVLSRESENLSAAIGLSDVYYHKNNKVKATEFMQKAYRLSSHSKTVQALKRKVEAMP